MKFVREIIYSLPFNHEIQEMVLEGLRLALFAAISTFITVLLETLTKVQTPDALVLIEILALRMGDKWLHEYNKKQKGLTKRENGGLAGF